MGKFFAGILVAVAIILLLAYLGFINFGAGGKGKGEEKKAPTSTAKEVKEEETKPQEIVVKIEVKKDVYLIEGEELTLSQIKEKVTDPSRLAKVVLINHYASTKSWDELKAALTEWKIEAVEE